MSEPNTLDQQINSLLEMKKVIPEMAKQSDAVQSGVRTLEEELKHPAYKLFESTIDSTMAVFNHPLVRQSLQKMGAKLGEEPIGDLITLITVCMTQVTYQTIVEYDELMKQEMDHVIDGIINRSNRTSADVDALMSAHKILRKQVGTIQDTLLAKGILDKETE